jgi:hypothetical protein
VEEDLAMMMRLRTWFRSQPKTFFADGIRRLVACWDCGFEYRRGHVRLSVVSVVCCQVEVSATSWSPVQRSPTDCGVSNVCDHETSK